MERLPAFVYPCSGCRNSGTRQSVNRCVQRQLVSFAGLEDKSQSAGIGVALVGIIGLREVAVAVLYPVSAIFHVIVPDVVAVIDAQLPCLLVVSHAEIRILAQVVPEGDTMRGGDIESSFVVVLQCDVDNTACSFRVVTGIGMSGGAYAGNIGRRDSTQIGSKCFTLQPYALSVHIDSSTAEGRKRQIPFAVKSHTGCMAQNIQ